MVAPRRRQREAPLERVGFRGHGEAGERRRSAARPRAWAAARATCGESSGAARVHKQGQIQEGPLTLFSTIAEKVAAWRRYRETVRQLSQFSDHELADIGIGRSDIARVAGGGTRAT
jgi:uncharacterized protein YjiS (DUF1127 family)